MEDWVKEEILPASDDGRESRSRCTTLSVPGGQIRECPFHRSESVHDSDAHSCHLKMDPVTSSNKHGTIALKSKTDSFRYLAVQPPYTPVRRVKGGEGRESRLQAGKRFLIFFLLINWD